jgi:SAM-dependent methyltransferase
MELFKQALGSISGGIVLDVATGEGNFIKTLVGNLKKYQEIIGIDKIEYTKTDGSIFHLEKVTFLQMDAEKLGFGGKSFDTVCISSSLHHLKDIQKVVEEMKRVLKPGGYLIIRETHQDIQIEAQLTDMYLHHWVAEIDTTLGFTHNRTFSRQEIIDLVGRLGIYSEKVYERSNLDLDPMNEDAIKDTEGIIDRYIRYAEGLSRYRTFQQRGEELRQQLYRVGVQWEPELIIIGKVHSGQVSRTTHPDR